MRGHIKGTYKHTENTKRKISKAQKGKKFSDEHKGKLSEALRGHKNALGKRSKEFGKKMSLINKGRIPWIKNRKHTPETKLKMRLKKIGKYIGEKHWNWKGGITPINQKIRGSLEYKLWEDSVLNWDCNCCQKCGENRINKLVAHHIRNFAQFPELRFAIDNGITFCRKCHNWFHRKHRKKNNTLKQLEEFLLNLKFNKFEKDECIACQDSKELNRESMFKHDDWCDKNKPTDYAEDKEKE